MNLHALMVGRQVEFKTVKGEANPKEDSANYKRFSSN